MLARAALGDEPEADAVRRLASTPETLEGALGNRAVYTALFRSERGDPLLTVSAFLVFAVAVHRGAQDLARAGSVSEWVGPGRRLPVLDVERLRAFLATAAHRLFLAELLASYTHVGSGALYVQSHRGWRRHRYSELDPVRFASLIELVPEGERPGIYRRLGDLALFLTGVFPDYSATYWTSPVHAQRLARTLPGDLGPDIDEGDSATLELFEELGRGWYKAACATAPRPPSARLRLVASVADHFSEARRVLNFIAERYIFPHRSRWFGATSG